MSRVRQLGRVAEPMVLTLDLDARSTAEEALGWTEAYFGENWAAFDECLADMDWLPLRGGVVVLIYEANQVLVEESLEGLKVLVRAFSSACDSYAEPIDQGEWWDRPAVPFHAVLQEEVAADFDRWHAAGADPIGF